MLWKAWNRAPINCCMAGSLLPLVGALGFVVLALASVLSVPSLEAVVAVLLELAGVMPSCASVCSSAVIKGLVEPEEELALEDCCSASCRKVSSELELVCWVDATPYVESALETVLIVIVLLHVEGD